MSVGGGRERPGTSADHDRARGDDLATLLSEVAQTLQQEVGVGATLQGVVDGAVALVPGVEHASLSTIVRRRAMVTRASSGELPEAVDRAQVETGQGPCLDTLYEQRTARLPSMARERRWPRFAARARELGVGSMLAVQLFVEGDSLGALNLFSSVPDAFGDESEHVALLFASHAAVAMSGAQEQESLRGAIDSRDLIGQAKGILMERHKVTAAAAFLVLSRVSQTSNRTLRDVASELVRQGSFEPPVPGATPAAPRR
ncbi:GAF and ANTAR domain-containing protein [Microlunatus capsulatus]|uniref:GAF domain-containing protein n=1 Tax=Microlunatus capsulatus TaxID=99117 RepID=A0ABS4Z3D1_9ACTN|nr:GAF and ANTAR domain-containing protein [Microlunatus capsulatus]MBP2415506.1 GAF domain-containing protein [Microlunatus capsulatus]